MGKAGSVRVNMRLRDEARFALEELAERMGCSQTAVVERLVIAAHQGRQPVGVNWTSAEGFGGDAVVEPLAIPGVTRGATVLGVGDEQRGYLPCRHCGVDGQIHPKTSPWRACPACQRDQHSNFPDCGRCARKERAAQVARQSTAADTGGIDFDPDWGA